MHFNVSVTSQDMQTSRLGLFSKFKRLVSVSSRLVRPTSQSRLGLSTGVLCPSLEIALLIYLHPHSFCLTNLLSWSYSTLGWAPKSAFRNNWSRFLHSLDDFSVIQPMQSKLLRELKTMTTTRENHPLDTAFLFQILYSSSQSQYRW